MPLPQRTKEEKKIYMEDWSIRNCEQRRAYKKAYNSSPRGKKLNRICKWKQMGMISDDWDKTHKRYVESTNCEYCDKVYIRDKFRHLDHNHSITNSHNIRGVLCKNCNIRDVLAPNYDPFLNKYTDLLYNLY